MTGLKVPRSRAQPWDCGLVAAGLKAMPQFPRDGWGLDNDLRSQLSGGDRKGGVLLVQEDLGAFLPLSISVDFPDPELNLFDPPPRPVEEDSLFVFVWFWGCHS